MFLPSIYANITYMVFIQSLSLLENRQSVFCGALSRYALEHLCKVIGIPIAHCPSNLLHIDRWLASSIFLASFIRYRVR